MAEVLPIIRAATIYYFSQDPIQANFIAMADFSDPIQAIQITRISLYFSVR